MLDPVIAQPVLTAEIAESSVVEAEVEPPDSGESTVERRGGPAEEAVSYQVFLTTGGSGSSASTTRVGRVGPAEDFIGIRSSP